MKFIATNDTEYTPTIDRLMRRRRKTPKAISTRALNAHTATSIGRISLTTRRRHGLRWTDAERCTRIPSARVAWQPCFGPDVEGQTLFARRTPTSGLRRGRLRRTSGATLEGAATDDPSR